MLSKLFLGATDHSLVQFIRSGFVGVMSLTVDFTILYVLTSQVGLYYLHSATLAFLGGISNCYLLSVLWVFPRRTLQNRSLEFTIFAVLGLIGLGLNHVLMYGITESGVHYLISKAVATVPVFGWNFASRKYLLFQERERQPGSGQAQYGLALENSSV
jgi:putative flippase GtrA